MEIALWKSLGPSLFGAMPEGVEWRGGRGRNGDGSADGAEAGHSGSSRGGTSGCGATAGRARCPFGRDPARDRRAVCRDRRAGGQPHALAAAADRAVAGDHPQRDGRPHRCRPAVRTAHLGRTAADRAGAAAVRRWLAAVRRACRGRARDDQRRTRRGGAQPRGHAGRGGQPCCPGCRPPPGWCWRRNRRGRCGISSSSRSARGGRWSCW